MPQVQTPTEWATLIKDPTPPKEGQYGASHMVTVRFADSEEVKVWFDVGEFSALKSGDQILLEWVKGKWRLCKTQPPELMQTLRARGGQVITPPSPTPPAPPTPPTPSPAAPVARRWNQDKRQALAENLQQRARLLKACHDEIAGLFVDQHGALLVSEETIQKYATSLYIDLSKTV